jgi:aspartate beta-hydroxylase
MGSDDHPAVDADDVINVPPRFLKYVAAFPAARDYRAFGTYPDLPSQPWYEDYLELPSELERNAELITEEFKRRAGSGFHRQSEPGVAREGEWDVCILFERGLRRGENCARFPLLTRILESHDIIKGLAGLVYFSRLGPHTRIAPHTGPTNMRLRCHLGILIPDRCGIAVGGVSRTWRQGKCIVFDDSFLHSSWNDSDVDRIVLVADIWHPRLSSIEVTLLKGLHRYVDLQAANLSRYWQENERARLSGARQAREERPARPE